MRSADRFVAMAMGTVTTAVWLMGTGSSSSQPLTRTPDPALSVYVAAHVDATIEHTAQALAAIRTYVAAARREPGAVRVEAMEELRPNHFDLIEVWRDEAAYQGHAAGWTAIRFHDVIAPWRGSPFEERLGTPVEP